MENNYSEFTGKALERGIQMFSNGITQAKVKHDITLNKLYTHASTLDFEKAKEGKKLLEEFNNQ
jgi:hypothetical protein